MELSTEIQAIVNEVLEESGREVVDGMSRDTRLRADLGLDSLDLAVLTVKLEAKYKVDVFKDGIVTTFGEILEKIDDR